jgi:hypothetical protein
MYSLLLNDLCQAEYISIYLKIRIFSLNKAPRISVAPRDLVFGFQIARLNFGDQIKMAFFIVRLPTFYYCFLIAVISASRL